MPNSLALLGGALAIAPRAKALSPVYESRSSWFPIIREPFAGAWQRNVQVTRDDVLSSADVFGCLTRITSDFAKLRPKLIQFDAESNIWVEVTNPAYSPVLRQPNPYQNDIQFKSSWLLSKLIFGNTYALKKRDNRGVVIGLYILDPLRTKVLVSYENNEVSIFYEVSPDNLSGVSEPVIVPAREIIHDRWNEIHHPLVGTSPLFACSLAATQGLNIQGNSAKFFGNASTPGGILTATGTITSAQAEQFKEQWEQNFGGNNVGRVAVLGGGLNFQQLTMTAVDAELLGQQQYSAEKICTAFHVPRFMIGVGPEPKYDNIDAQLSLYYSLCQQFHIESFERVVADGLGMGINIGVELDVLNGITRMDTATKFKTIAEGVRGGFLAPNEGRRMVDLKKVEGGDSPYLQEQNWPLKFLNNRELPTRPATEPAPIVPPAEPPEKEMGLKQDTIDREHIPDYTFAALTKELYDDTEGMQKVWEHEAA